MPNIEVGGKQFEVDEDGYMADLEDWNKDIATFMAKGDGMDTYRLPLGNYKFP